MADFDKWAADLADRIAAKEKAKAAPKVQCDTCQDTGHHMNMVCYGGGPVEVEVHCIDCGGPLAGQAWRDD